MDGVGAVRVVLAGDAALTALVPANSIRTGILPLGTDLPAISITQVSAVDLNIPNPGEYRQVTERVQVTVLERTYPAQKQVLAAVKKAAADKLYPIVPGISAVTIHTESGGPDFMNEDASIYMGSIDFRVIYNQER